MAVGETAALWGLFVPAILAQPHHVSSLVERPCRQAYDRPCGVGFAGLEGEAVKFEEENTDHKTSSLVAIDKRMVTDNARCVEGGHFDDAWRISVSVVLAGPGERRFKERLIANPFRPSVDGQIAVVDREHIANLDPERLFPLFGHRYFARACNVLR